MALLSSLFRRVHAESTTLLESLEEVRQPSTKGQGQFTERATRRAVVDYSRCRAAHKAQVKTATKVAYNACLLSLNGGKKPKRVNAEQKVLAQAAAAQAADTWQSKFKAPYLKAELIDAAEIQVPRAASHFDLWVMIQGARLTVPAKKHKALNRALALPGAEIGNSAVVFRKNGKWYAQVSVTIPCPEPYQVKGWLGCDVGVRASVTRSDGYQGPDLRPILHKQRDKRAEQQRQGLDRPLGNQSPSRQAIAREARKAVTVCLHSHRGIALESPERLPRWKQWAARFFAKRALLLAAIMGVPVQSIAPPYTSLTCSRCGSVQTFRYRCMFRCLKCGFTHNADFNASCVIRYRAHELTSSSSSSLSLLPYGGGADE